MVKSHTPNDPLVVPPHAFHACYVSLISRAYVILNTSHMKGVLAWTLVTGLRPSLLCSIAPREHVGLKDCY